MNQKSIQAIFNTRSTLQNLNDVLSIDIIEISAGRGLEHLNALHLHRGNYFREQAPHLIDKMDCPTEKLIDNRSLILIARHQSLIVSTLRLTPRSFELEQFDIHEINFENYQNYCEIGRLTTNSALDPLTAALVVRHLLCVAGLIGIEEKNYEGIVAICRPNRTSFFEKFGLTSKAIFFAEERNNTYHFLAADMNDVLNSTAGLQENEKLLRQRLRKSFMKNII